MRWSTPVRIRWGDVDGYGHVNNVALAEYVQEARTRFFRQPEWGGTLTAAELNSFIIVAHQELEYVAQLSYRAEPVHVDAWVTRATGASIDLGFEVWDEPHGELFLRATNLVALVPNGSGAPRRLTDQELAAAAQFSGDPVAFRRHSYRGRHSA